MTKLKVLDLFSGIGGFSLGLERATLEGAEIDGFETVAFCEIEEFPRKVLAKHWPDVSRYRDVRELTGERLSADGIAIDVITGGFPCQDVSTAGAAWGKKKGLDGERSGLWSECARLIDELRPRFAIFENVSALLSDGLHRVMREISALGYDAEWHCIRASTIGCAQPRDRIWIIAYPAKERNKGLITSADISAARQGWAGCQEDLQSIYNAPFEQRDSRPPALFRRMDDRPPNWMDRVGACGNAVVPQIPELIGRAILRHINEGETQ